MAKEKSKQSEPMSKPNLVPVIKSDGQAIKIIFSGRVKIASNDSRVSIIRR